jgi:hypothetical protein
MPLLPIMMKSYGGMQGISAKPLANCKDHASSIQFVYLHLVGVHQLILSLSSSLISKHIDTFGLRAAMMDQQT